jgi:hypothetical protein
MPLQLDNTQVFYSQLAISALGLLFTGIMTIVDQPHSSIYLPIFTSLLFVWVPNPQQKIIMNSPSDSTTILPVTNPVTTPSTVLPVEPPLIHPSEQV